MIAEINSPAESGHMFCCQAKMKFSQLGGALVGGIVKGLNGDAATVGCAVFEREPLPEQVGAPVRFADVVHGRPSVIEQQVIVLRVKFVGAIKQADRPRLVAAKSQVGQLPLGFDVIGIQLEATLKCGDGFFMLAAVVEHVP